MKYNRRERWAESFYRWGNDNKQELHLIEQTLNKRLCMYCSKKKIHSGPIIGNEDFFGREPTWHVWDGDQWLYCGQSQQQAYAKYNDLLKRIETEGI